MYFINVYIKENEVEVFLRKFNDLESSVIVFYNYLTLLFSQSLLFFCNDNVTDYVLSMPTQRS